MKVDQILNKVPYFPHTRVEVPVPQPEEILKSLKKPSLLQQFVIMKTKLYNEIKEWPFRFTLHHEI